MRKSRCTKENSFAPNHTTSQLLLQTGLDPISYFLLTLRTGLSLLPQSQSSYMVLSSKTTVDLGARTLEEGHWAWWLGWKAIPAILRRACLPYTEESSGFSHKLSP